MFKFHPLGCKIQLPEPRYLIGAGSDFVKILANSGAITKNFSFLRTRNLNFSLSKTNFEHTPNTLTIILQWFING